MGGYSITNSASFSDSFDSLLNQLRQEISELRKLTADDADRSELVDQIEDVGNKEIKHLEECRHLIDDKQIDAVHFRNKQMY